MCKVYNIPYFMYYYLFISFSIFYIKKNYNQERPKHSPRPSKKPIPLKRKVIPPFKIYIKKVCARMKVGRQASPRFYYIFFYFIKSLLSFLFSFFYVHHMVEEPKKLFILFSFISLLTIYHCCWFIYLPFDHLVNTYG